MRASWTGREARAETASGKPARDLSQTDLYPSPANGCMLSARGTPPSGVVERDEGCTMFLQIMQGKVRDQESLKQQMDEWRAKYKPQAIGYLGTTFGTTDDGRFIALARFESESAARENSHQPEQNAWWEKFSSAFDGEISFTDCTKVDTMMGGGSDDAGFVQIMSGRAVDPAAMRSAGRAMESEMGATRPDLLGGIVGWHGDREFTQAIYFISEEAARKGEAEAEGDPGMDEWAKMIDGEMSFIDLRSPEYD